MSPPSLLRVLCIRLVGLRAEQALRKVFRRRGTPRRGAHLLHLSTYEDSGRATTVFGTCLRAALGPHARSEAPDDEQLLGTTVSFSTVGLACTMDLLCHCTASSSRCRCRADLSRTKSFCLSGATCCLLSIAMFIWSIE